MVDVQHLSNELLREVSQKNCDLSAYQNLHTPQPTRVSSRSHIRASQLVRILPVVQLYTKATLDLKSIGTTTCTLSVYYTVRGVNHRTSDLYMDAPVHESIEQRTELAFDRHQWRLHVAALAGEGDYDTQPTNTPEETKAAIDKLASDSILAYSDGAVTVMAQVGSGAKQDSVHGSARNRTVPSMLSLICGVLSLLTQKTRTTANAP